MSASDEARKLAVFVCVQSLMDPGLQDLTRQEHNQEHEVVFFSSRERAVGEGEGVGWGTGRPGGVRSVNELRSTESIKLMGFQIRHFDSGQASSLRLSADGSGSPGPARGSGVKDSQIVVVSSLTGACAGRLRCLPAPTSGEVGVVSCCRLAWFCRLWQGLGHTEIA